MAAQRLDDDEAAGLRFRRFAAAVGFLTRLPVPPAYLDDAPVSRAVWAFPAVGFLIGAAGAIVLLLATMVGIPSPVAATLAIATVVWVTGALHEDGLADTFDGFGGQSRDERLAIMRDGHLGTFGVAALVLTLALRIAAMAVLAGRSPVMAALVLAAAETVSRGAMAAAWRLGVPARDDGLAAGEGPDRTDVGVAVAASLGALLVLAVPAIGVVATLAATVFAMIGAYMISHVATRTLGGYTGDTLGACQQISLAAFMVGASLA